MAPDQLVSPEYTKSIEEILLGEIFCYIFNYVFNLFVNFYD